MFNFRRYIPARPAIRCEALPCPDACKAKIGYYRALVGCEQDVVWLDIPVNDSSRVQHMYTGKLSAAVQSGKRGYERERTIWAM